MLNKIIDIYLGKATEAWRGWAAARRLPRLPDHAAGAGSAAFADRLAARSMPATWRRCSFG